MPDCIIVGGGIIGMLTAYELYKRDVDVLLIERGKLGGESSWAGGGIISPLYPWLYPESVNQLAHHSKALYPKLIDELQNTSCISCDYLQSGLLLAGNIEKSQVNDWSKKWSEPLSFIDNQCGLNEIEPKLNDKYTNGIWMPNIYQVRNPCIVKAFKKTFEVLKIPFLDNMDVNELLISNGKISGVRLKDKLIHADKVIIASGAWSAQLVDQTINVEPIKGQMIMYRGSIDLVKRMVLIDGHYIIPRIDGRILAGSTLEKKGFDKSISAEAMQELHQAAIDIIPALGDLPIERQWSGLRPGTENGIPYICQHNETKGLYINSGHFRNGIVLGPASAVLMADLVMGADPSVDAAPYNMGAVH